MGLKTLLQKRPLINRNTWLPVCACVCVFKIIYFSNIYFIGIQSASQCCVSFCCLLQQRESTMYTHVTSLWGLPPAPQLTPSGHQRASDWAPALCSRFLLARWVLYMAVCICHASLSLSTSPSLTVCTSPFSFNWPISVNWPKVLVWV